MANCSPTDSENLYQNLCSYEYLPRFRYNPATTPKSLLRTKWAAMALPFPPLPPTLDRKLDNCESGVWIIRVPPPVFRVAVRGFVFDQERAPEDISARQILTKRGCSAVLLCQASRSVWVSEFACKNLYCQGMEVTTDLGTPWFERRLSRLYNLSSGDSANLVWVAGLWFSGRARTSPPDFRSGLPALQSWP